MRIKVTQSDIDDANSYPETDRGDLRNPISFAAERAIGRCNISQHGQTYYLVGISQDFSINADIYTKYQSWCDSGDMQPFNFTAVPVEL